MLHVDAGEVQAGRLQQRQDGRIADQVDPGSDPHPAVRDGRPYRIAMHRLDPSAG
jgi:hypothetical protein